MPSTLRTFLVPVAAAVACTALVALVVTASNRQAVIITMPSAATSPSTIEPAILTTGDATVSVRPDLATVLAGVESQQGTAAAAQSDLATKAGKLIARIKALGVADKDLNTIDYQVGPVYSSAGTITGYRAGEELQVKWHNVDTVGKTLDAIGQEGGATNITVNLGLADPKTALADARTQAVGDAKAKAQALASASGVKLGPVLRISDLSSSTRYPAPVSFGAAANPTTQIPVGATDVEASVEVDFAIV